MTKRVRWSWAVEPMPARGFGPQQVRVYVASVYVDGRCLDAVVCANRREAHALALSMARATELALDDESASSAEVRRG